MADAMQSRRPLKTYSGAVKRALAVDLDDSQNKRRRAEPEVQTKHIVRRGTLDGWITSSSPSSTTSNWDSSAAAVETLSSTPPSSPPPTASSLSAESCFALPPAAVQLETTDAPSRKHPRPKLVQMQLNTGRDMHKTCQDCGMTFVTSNAQDVSLHDLYHLRMSHNVLHGIRLGKTFADKAEVRIGQTSQQGGVIVMVDAHSRNFERRKAMEVLELVQDELGAVPIDQHELWEVIRPVALSRYRIFLYMLGDLAIGLCLVKVISQAFETEQEPDTAEVGLDGRCEAGVTLSTRPMFAQLGISRIWTSKSNRGRGVATALLDCVMQEFGRFYTIPRSQVAFSQPTTSGLALARRWHGKPHGWLVYLD